MSRCFCPKVQVMVGSFEPHFNEAFGEVIHSKRELKETVRRYNEERGMDLQEVGSDPVKARKPVRRGVDRDQVISEARKIRGR